MNEPPPLPSARKKKSSWAAIAVTLAYPGAGQFLQGRRVAGFLLTGLTTIVALWWMQAMLAAVAANFREALETGRSEPLAVARAVALPTKILGLCYVVSLADVLLAHVQPARRR